MTRPIKVLIDKKALASNLQLIKKKMPKSFLWAVVKADAYGHGLNNLLEVFNLYCDGLAVLDIPQAIEVRKLGWKKSILMIEGFFSPEDILQAIREDIELVIHSDWQIELLRQHSIQKTLRVHIKCNSGMNRLGFSPEEVETKKNQLEAIPGIEVVSLVSHFANSDLLPNHGRDVLTVENQITTLANKERMFDLCLCNSGGILWYSNTHSQAVRAGIAMYGVSPNSEISEESLGLRPVMTLKAQVIAIREIGPGDSVGYGSKFKATKKMRVAVLACGYADGYPRAISEEAWVGIKGKKCQILGAVSMDMMTVDVSNLSEIEIGTEAEIWGTFPKVNQVGLWANTIGYELLTKINKRVKKIYI